MYIIQIIEDSVKNYIQSIPRKGMYTEHCISLVVFPTINSTSLEVYCISLEVFPTINRSLEESLRNISTNLTNFVENQ